MLFGKKKIVGLDMGQRAIKGVVLNKKRGRVFLENIFLYDFAETNPNYPNNSDIVSGLSTLTEVHGLTKYHAIFNLGGHNVNSFDLQLPEMPKKELQVIIAGEVEKHINYSIDKCSYDYKIYENEDEEDSVYKIKVYTTKLNKVKVNMKMLSSASLNPYIIDSDIEAITRMLDFNDYIKKNHCHILVDFGETQTLVALLLGSQLVSLTMINQSMGLINRKITKELSLSYQEGESYKKSIDLSIEDVNEGYNKTIDLNKDVEQNIVNEEEAQRIASTAFTEILTKIQENIDYLSEFHFKKWPVAAFYFTGGGSACKGLCEVFEEYYKVPCIIPNPFKNIELSSKSEIRESLIFENMNTMAISVGLALRGVS